MKVMIACSAKESLPKDYYELASNVSTVLAKRGHKLVFGGSDHGMMEKCYMTFKYEESKVKAIVTTHDAEELDSLELDASEVVPTSFERTKRLYEASDIILILPGGVGTYAEFFSMLDYKRCNSYNKKPIILINYKDFFTPMINMLKESYDRGFILKNDLREFDIINNVEGLEFYIKQLEIEMKEGK